MRRHGNPSRRTLEKLLGVAGSSLAEFEALRVSPAPSQEVAAEDLTDAHWGWRGAPILPLPLYRCSTAGAWGKQGLELWRIERLRPIAQLPRPPSLSFDSQAFAIEVAGPAMAPRLRIGRHIAISPGASFKPDDDVLVVLTDTRSSQLGLASQFIGHEDEGIVIRQYREDRRAIIPAKEILALAVIVGELI